MHSLCCFLVFNFEFFSQYFDHVVFESGLRLFNRVFSLSLYVDLFDIQPRLSASKVELERCVLSLKSGILLLEGRVCDKWSCLCYLRILEKLCVWLFLRDIYTRGLDWSVGGHSRHALLAL